MRTCLENEMEIGDDVVDERWERTQNPLCMGVSDLNDSTSVRSNLALVYIRIWGGAAPITQNMSQNTKMDPSMIFHA